MPHMHHTHPEPEDRTDIAPPPPPPAALWKNFTAEQRAKVEEIAAWQRSAGLDDAAFVEGCTAMSVQTWYQLRTGRYGAKDCSKMVTIAGKHAVERRALYTRSQSLVLKPLGFVETDKWHEVLSAVESAQTAADIGDDDKIVWVIGESGMGKTEIARQLVARKTARLITASESWRESYFDALTDFAAAVNAAEPQTSDGKPKAWPSKGAAERAIMRQLAERPCVLCINEVEFFSRRVLNLLRKIADETRTVVVIFCVPEFHRQIVAQGGAYAKQLRTRTEGVVHLDAVEITDAVKVLNTYWPRNPDVKAEAKELRDYCNHFGGWRVLKRVARHLRCQFPDSNVPPAPADVSAAIQIQRDYQEAA